MKWRALAVAMVGLSATLGACSLQNEWEAYCNLPGRCAELDAGEGPILPILIAQGSRDRRIVLAGKYLAGAQTVVVLSNTGVDAGTASIASSDYGNVELDVTVDHGVAVGTLLTLEVAWDRPDKESQKSIPLEVTPITVAENGDDDGGFGTPFSPYGTLRHANEVAGFNDTIQLAAGRFAGIHPPGACDPDSGLKPGVKVHGYATDASVVTGPGLCGFNVFEANQEVSQLTVTGFTAGILASGTGPDGGPRPTVSNVAVTGCDAGVVAIPGASLQLDSVDLTANDFGLRSVGADVVMQNGTISLSAGNGVWMAGDFGRLVLDGVNTSNNAGATSGDLNGAGILLNADAGKVTLGPGTQSTGNSSTGVTIAGRGNQVTLDGASLEGGNNVALLVMGNESTVLLRNSSLASDSTCIEVRSFQLFNGGTGDGQYGNSTLTCATTINDTRASGPAMDFAGTTFGGFGVPPAGTTVDGGSANTYGITFAGSTLVRFH